MIMRIFLIGGKCPFMQGFFNSAELMCLRIHPVLRKIFKWIIAKIAEPRVIFIFKFRSRADFVLVNLP